MRLLPLLFVPLTLQAAEVSTSIKDGVATFKSGEVILTVYQFEGTVAVLKGEGTKPLAKPFFYPINTPSGVQVTRDWPLKRGTAGETVDHFHQKSAWFCHGDVIPDGVTLKTKNKHAVGVDFWTEDTGHGRIETILCEVMPNTARTTANQLAWKTADGEQILYEERAIHVRIVEGGTQISVDTRLLAKVPVTFGDTKEGSFGVRVHDDLRLEKTKATVTSSDGSSLTGPKKTTLPMWGQVAAWHDYSGEVAGKPCGVALFTHPDDKYQSCWHTRDYGLLAANPFGRNKSGFPAMKGKTDLIKLEKGEYVRFRFAIFAHDGDVKTGRVAEAYAAFLKK